MQVTPIEKFFVWTDEKIEDFSSLPHPHNILELRDGKEDIKNLLILLNLFMVFHLLINEKAILQIFRRGRIH